MSEEEKVINKKIQIDLEVDTNTVDSSNFVLLLKSTTLSSNFIRRGIGR